MTKIWRVVIWIVLLLFALGLVLGGMGWLTGASLPRMAEMVFGGRAAANEAVSTAGGRLVAAARELLQQLRGTF